MPERRIEDNKMTSYQQEKLEQASALTVGNILGIKKGERVLVLTNPVDNLDYVALSLVRASHNVGAQPNLVYQTPKTDSEFMEPQVLESFKQEPDVYIGVNKFSTGTDPEGTRKHYKAKGHLARRDIRFLLLEQKKMRGFWFQKAQPESFAKFVEANFSEIKSLSRKLVSHLNQASRVIVKTGLSEELRVDIDGHTGSDEFGDFRTPGLCGNIPFGEAYISPVAKRASGSIILDGMTCLSDGEMYIKNPIKVTYDKGFVVDATGDREADILREDFRKIEKKIQKANQKGQVKDAEVATYTKNITALGELGIGLNRRARLYEGVGTMEAEKVFGTVHIAFGLDYDGHIKAINHMDAVTRQPEVWLEYPDGRKKLVLRKNEFLV
ncbi:aminopeptidase [Patescibacteria group bacterium]